MKSTVRILSVAVLIFATTASYASDDHAAMSGAETGKVLTILKPDDADFKAIPGAAPCNKMANLRGDLSKEAASFMSHMTPGCIAPWHWHTPTEEIVILKGTAVAQMKGGEPETLPTGAYSQLPAKHGHRFRCTEESDCVVLVIADGPFDIHWLGENGEEISAEEAQKRAEAEGTKGW